MTHEEYVQRRAEAEAPGVEHHRSPPTCVTPGPSLQVAKAEWSCAQADSQLERAITDLLSEANNTQATPRD